MYFKMWPPFWFLAPPGFWPPLLLNPGDGPVTFAKSMEIMDDRTRTY